MGQGIDKPGKSLYGSAMQTLQAVIEYFGGTHQSLADALGIERAAVTMWRGKIPPLRAYEIERLSDGKFKAEDLMKRRRKKPERRGSESRAADG